MSDKLLSDDRRTVVFGMTQIGRDASMGMSGIVVVGGGGGGRWRWGRRSWGGGGGSSDGEGVGKGGRKESKLPEYEGG